jgi:hypothetical protein
MEIIKQLMPTSKLSVKLALAVCAVFAFAAAPAQAVLVTWDFNPTNANASVGSASHTFTSGGYSITAYGYDVVSGPDTPHTLYYKDAPGSPYDHGLGFVGTPHNEIQTNNYIQLDLSSILSQGFTGGQLKVSSIDPGESFSVYGSNTLGSLGTFLNTYGDTNNNLWISVPSFGTYKYISVIAAGGDELLWAFKATVTPIPEAASLLPTILLAIAVTAFEARRRRRVTA